MREVKRKIVRVTNRRGKKRKKYKWSLKRRGMTFNAYSGRFEAVMEDTRSGRRRIKRIERFCNRKNLNFKCVDEKYTRNSNYRRLYFDKHTPDFMGKYFCIYCGRLLSRENVQVDHIIPVNQAESSPFIQWLIDAKKWESINEYGNLGASCSRCNQAKKDKMGIWVVRGKLGQKRWLQYVRLASRIVMFLLTMTAFAAVAWWLYLK